MSDVIYGWSLMRSSFFWYFWPSPDFIKSEISPFCQIFANRYHLSVQTADVICRLTLHKSDRPHVFTAWDVIQLQVGRVLGLVVPPSVPYLGRVNNIWRGFTSFRCRVYILRYSSACDRGFMCFVFGPCTLTGSKLKHTKQIPQAGE